MTLMMWPALFPPAPEPRHRAVAATVQVICVAVPDGLAQATSAEPSLTLAGLARSVPERVRVSVPVVEQLATWRAAAEASPQCTLST